jgi:uncharacterized membrane protein
MNSSSAKYSPVQTFLIGLMALLPLVLTIGVTIWIAGLLARFLGPQSLFGNLLISLGLSFSFVNSAFFAYFFGTVIVLAMIYILGLAFQLGLKGPMQKLLNRLIRRIPLVGGIYDLAGRFVEMFDKKDSPELKSMTPVWCFFGGEGGTAVLGLLPSPEEVKLGDHLYHGILVPSAPVPVGGGLLFVPKDWVKPATFGAEGLTSIYVSMGVTVPSVLGQSNEMLQANAQKEPDSLKEGKNHVAE